MGCRLVVTQGPDTGRTFELADGKTITIGRGSNTDTQLTDPSVSRLHCELTVSGGRAVLLDAGSSSGTFIRNERINEREIASGDLIEIGQTRLRFESEHVHRESTVLREPAGPAAPAAVVALSALVGQELGEYRLEQVLARGTSGMVFLATDVIQNRPAAVKVLTSEFARDAEQRQRFVRAMKTMLPIRHPNLIELYGAGTHGDCCWLAMEYVEGPNLADVIDEARRSGVSDWRGALRAAIHVGRAIEEGWLQNIVHRNLTPQNILRRRSDGVHKLGDLMLAKALEGELSRSVTIAGRMLGNVCYMSPERTKSEGRLDCRSDIYELGAVTYALLTGAPPHEHKSTVDLVLMVRNTAPAKPRNVDATIPQELENIVLKMLAKSPDERYADPTKMLKDLEAVAADHQVPV
jgi:serine/threonine protein kinase